MPKKNGKPNYAVIQKHVFDRIHVTGEEIKNDFPNWLQTVEDKRMYRNFTDHEGKPFDNIGAWLVSTFPNGCSMGGTQFSITYEEAKKLTEGHPIHDVLVKHQPSRGRGRPKKTEANKHSRECLNRSNPTKRAVLEARLAQEHPKVYADYRLGKHKSVRAAAEAAGLVKPGHDPVMRLKAYWKKANAKQRQEFLKWIGEQGGETDSTDEAG